MATAIFNAIFANSLGVFITPVLTILLLGNFKLRNTSYVDTNVFYIIRLRARSVTTRDVDKVRKSCNSAYGYWSALSFNTSSRSCRETPKLLKTLQFVAPPRHRVQHLFRYISHWFRNQWHSPRSTLRRSAGVVSVSCRALLEPFRTALPRIRPATKMRWIILRNSKNTRVWNSIHQDGVRPSPRPIRYLGAVTSVCSHTIGVRVKLTSASITRND